mmetsp:Transcript_37759/g.52435  ORF Transcript_37759/g.52435 Transcript_37759/m.52435 type:complete len:149 (+) Transcript_37759:133-579(+)|eukprot:CAMPEP_0196595386 /NCGR_PEP_ID=MMETSP1081-20130531/80966_1 /TAXON_ID=36882 /ORGANISM="Pyramimonas amylifera, Strain CCMP720" /LENGTH=148 /DNA_ID=CAMNT_0041919939 /DNA_START=131 /DNA_END=577 /DNA_ORIENTATION=+
MARVAQLNLVSKLVAHSERARSRDSVFLLSKGKSSRVYILRSLRGDVHLSKANPSWVIKSTTEDQEGCPVYDKDGWVIGWKGAEIECDMAPETDPEGRMSGSWDDGPIEGCLNPDAVNYDPLADVEDGSCVLPDDDCVGNDCLLPNQK